MMDRLSRHLYLSPIAETHRLLRLNLLGTPCLFYSSRIILSVVWDLVWYTNRQVRVSISFGFMCVGVDGGEGVVLVVYHTI